MISAIFFITYISDIFVGGNTTFVSMISLAMTNQLNQTTASDGGEIGRMQEILVKFCGSKPVSRRHIGNRLECLIVQL